MNNFWDQIKNTKKILALAPLAGITDEAFRQICKEQGADVVYSEMASATALVYSPEKTLKMLKFKEVERPYVVQLFGGEPKHFIEATKIITKEIKPDGIDINFGCPVKKVIKQGAGVALFKNFDKSKQVITNVLDNTTLPVSIKTRTKVGSYLLSDFLKNIKDLNIACLMVHGRTFAQGFSGVVDYSAILHTRKYFKGVVLANGGVHNIIDAEKLLNKSGADGIGIAQGCLGRPWLFAEIKKNETFNYCFADVKKIIIKHAKLNYKYKGKNGIVEMRKHLSWYVSGFSGAKQIRQELININTVKDIEKILNLIN